MCVCVCSCVRACVCVCVLLSRTLSKSSFKQLHLRFVTDRPADKQTAKPHSSRNTRQSLQSPGLHGWSKITATRGIWTGGHLCLNNPCFTQKGTLVCDRQIDRQTESLCSYTNGFVSIAHFQENDQALDSSRAYKLFFFSNMSYCP